MRFSAFVAAVSATLLASMAAGHGSSTDAAIFIAAALIIVALPGKPTTSKDADDE